jgi:hypothetical protein
VVHTGQWRNASGVSVGKPEVKIPLRRPGHRWEDNIKMDKLQVLVNMVMNLQVPQNAKIFLTSSGTISL